MKIGIHSKVTTKKMVDEFIAKLIEKSRKISSSGLFLKGLLWMNHYLNRFITHLHMNSIL